VKVVLHSSLPMISAAFESLLTSLLDGSTIVLTSDEDRLAETCADVDPDLVLLLSAEPFGADVAGWVNEVRSRCEKAGVLVIVSGFELDVLSVIEHGSTAIMVLEDSVDDFTYSIRKVLGGERFLTSKITFPVLTTAKAGIADSAGLVEELSSRDRQVLRLIGAGLSNNEIARELHLGVSTVKSYVSRLFTKLRVRDRVQAALLANQLELFESATSGKQDG
jgi:DNA-binding NarL/FixJ family response regulator